MIGTTFSILDILDKLGFAPKQTGREPFGGNLSFYDVHSSKGDLRKVSIIDKRGTKTSRWKKIDKERKSNAYLSRLLHVRNKLKKYPKEQHKQLRLNLNNEIIKVLETRKKVQYHIIKLD